jgi:hypothetical protein
VSSTRLTNREKQQIYFEQFRKSYSLPDGIIEYDDKPDVRLQGERTIGIEITNFYVEDGSVPGSEEVQRRLREKTVSNAQAIYQRGNSGTFKLRLGFDSAHPIRNYGDLAGKIADLDVRIEERANGLVGRDIFRDIPELSFAWLSSGDYGDSIWEVSQVYNGSIMSLKRLKEKIKEKEGKSLQYKRCDAYWLLFVVDFLDRAQDQKSMLRASTRSDPTCLKKSSFTRRLSSKS